jgi:hypothetical protein
MIRLPILSLLALPFVLACLVWLFGRAAGSDAPRSTIQSQAHAPDVTSEPRALPRFLELPRSPRQEVSVALAAPEETPPSGRSEQPAPELDARASRRAPVRVHGRVRVGGRPLAACELAFHPLGEGLDADEEDWDITDESGRYEVELDPGSYAVLNEANGELLTSVHVPAAATQLTLDLDLAP